MWRRNFLYLLLGPFVASSAVFLPKNDVEEALPFGNDFATASATVPVAGAASDAVSDFFDGRDIHYNPPIGYYLTNIVEVLRFDSGAFAIYAVVRDIQKQRNVNKIIWTPDGVTFPPEGFRDLPANAGYGNVAATDFVPPRAAGLKRPFGVFMARYDYESLMFCNIDPNTGVPDCPDGDEHHIFDRQTDSDNVDRTLRTIKQQEKTHLLIHTLRSTCALRTTWTEPGTRYTEVNGTRVQLKGPAGNVLKNCVAINRLNDTLIVSTSDTPPVVIPGKDVITYYSDEDRIRGATFVPEQEKVHYLEGAAAGSILRWTPDYAFMLTQNEYIPENAPTRFSTLLSPLTLVRWNEAGYPAKHLTRYLAPNITNSRDNSPFSHAIPGLLPEVASQKCNYAHLGDYGSNGYLITIEPTTPDLQNAKIVGKLFRPDLDVVGPREQSFHSEGNTYIPRSTFEPDAPPILTLEYEFSDVGREGLMRWSVPGKPILQVRTPARTEPLPAGERRLLHILIDLHSVEIFGDGMSLSTTYLARYLNPTFGGMCFQSGGTAPVSFSYASRWSPYRYGSVSAAATPCRLSVYGLFSLLIISAVATFF